jgi:hypothetical protein
MLSQKIDEFREKEKQEELVIEQEKAGRSRSLNDKGALRDHYGQHSYQTNRSNSSEGSNSGYIGRFRAWRQDA